MIFGDWRHSSNLNGSTESADVAKIRIIENARTSEATTRSLLRLFLSWIVAIEAIALLAIGALLLKELYHAPGARAPRTAAERTLMNAEAAVEADPDNPTARAELAEAFIASGLYESAIEQAKIGLRLDKNSAKCWYALGLAQKGAGDHDAAMESFKKAASIKGMLADFYSDAYYQIGEVEMSRKRYVAAAAAYAAAARSDPNIDADILYSLAIALEKGGKKSEAIAAYERVLEYLPGDWRSLKALKRLGADPDHLPSPSPD